MDEGKKIYVIGVGPGDPVLLTGLARRTIEKAQTVIGSQRLAETMLPVKANILQLDIKDYVPFIHSSSNSGGDICILVSGDVGWFSAAKTLARDLGPQFQLQLINGVSSFQYLMGKLGKSYEDVCIASAHGRNLNIVPLVAYNEKVFTFTGGAIKAHDIIRELIDSGLSDVEVNIGENLSDHNERVLQGNAREFSSHSFADLSVMYIENKNFTNPLKRIRDAEFIRGKPPMTKEAVRCLSIAALEINPNDTIVDIGAGTGSVAIEMARKASRGLVYALEKNSDALDLIRQNIQKFKAFNVIPLNSYAPEGLESLKKIDKAFIGGSGGKLMEVVDHLIMQNPSVRFVINAVTLETLNECMNVCKSKNLKFEVICINAARSEKLGGYNLMKAENPIYIITAEGTDG